MSRRTELSHRIWRTVIVAGAMLAAPPVAADHPAPSPAPTPAPAQAKPKAKRPPDTHASVTREIEETDRAIDAAVDRYVAAVSQPADAGGGPTGAAMAQTQLEALRARRAALAKRLARVPAPKPPAEPPAIVVRLETVYADADARLLAAIDALAKVRTDAEQAAAARELGDARTTRFALGRRLARARLAKRSRGDGDRPRGRGFVLA